ncbi:MAG: four helix bundle suffix domain-containing protein [Planctomycetota bacterium]|jgi:four helix bundle suffix protein
MATHPAPLIPPHGGYRKLKSFRVAQLAYDVTVLFVDRYIDRFSRTRDQMVQAARSGVQNIAEGSQASGTSKKTELRLTNVARASLEELRLDYEDFLRQHSLPVLAPDGPELTRFKSLRASTLSQVRTWVKDEHSPTCPSKALAANAALSLLNLACHLLDRQVARLAKDFEEEGGFSERLYRVRRARKRSS